jgi:hypothetical protein
MNLQCTNLCQRNEIFDSVDHQVVASRIFLLDRYETNRLGSPDAGMLLEKALLVCALGTANQRQRPVSDVWQNPLCDTQVILSKLQLGSLLHR